MISNYKLGHLNGYILDSYEIDKNYISTSVPSLF